MVRRDLRRKNSWIHHYRYHRFCKITLNEQTKKNTYIPNYY